MTRPKILIQTDGEITELYIDGKKVNKATLIDFNFHVGEDGISLNYERFATDGNGLVKVTNNNELAREKFTVRL